MDSRRSERERTAHPLLRRMKTLTDKEMPAVPIRTAASEMLDTVSLVIFWLKGVGHLQSVRSAVVRCSAVHTSQHCGSSSRSNRIVCPYAESRRATIIASGFVPCTLASDVLFCASLTMRTPASLPLNAPP